MVPRGWLSMGALAVLLILSVAARADDMAALSNFAAAKIVIGQADFTSGECNQGSDVPAANNLCVPEGAPSRRKGRLYIPDSSDNRVLGFNKVPKKSDASANFVLGQPDLSTANFGLPPSASTFQFPARLATAGKKLFVVDFGNSRVLIWNKLPSVTGTPADVVVGQPDFTSNSPSTTQSGLNLPEGITVAGGKLFVSDRNNNRILIWNSIPTVNDTSADVVVGQKDFISSAPAKPPTQAGFNEPEGLWSDGKRLAVADSSNNRVLIWNNIPAVNGAPADVVVGQADFTSNDIAEPPDAQSLGQPADVSSDGKRLFVADRDNSRVLVYQPFPMTNQPAATIVLGQSDFTHGEPNAGGAISARGLESPIGISFSRGELFVTDTDNSRVLVFSAK